MLPLGQPLTDPALTWSRDASDHRGNSPRLNCNMLVFLSFNQESNAALAESAKSCIAWKSIVDQKGQG